jgi:hypothetical protein
VGTCTGRCSDAHHVIGPEQHVVTYVVVPVRVRCEASCEEVMRIEWGDDGEPGIWGDTYVLADDDGRWTFDPLAQQAAVRYIRDLLGRVPF